MSRLLKKANRRIKRLRTTLARLLFSMHRKVECNLCGWHGHRFLSDEWHKNIVCPNCGALVRHRMIIAALENLSVPGNRVIAGKKALHFAPESRLSARLRSMASTYTTADLNRSDVDLRIDMSDMKTINDKEYGAVIACDVLEHILDDKRAISEIHRILTPGGVAILTVPQKDDLEITYSDSSITTPDARVAAFGHHDHLRIYGRDFTKMLEEGGFLVLEIGSDSFPKELQKEHVLKPPFISTRPLATNNQLIFFATRQN